jgi:hypothetical protein
MNRANRLMPCRDALTKSQRPLLGPERRKTMSLAFRQLGYRCRSASDLNDIAKRMADSGRLRQHKPSTLEDWRRNDFSFIAPGAEAFERDVPAAEIHLLHAGHFALNEKNDEIANLILAFLAKHSV